MDNRENTTYHFNSCIIMNEIDPILSISLMITKANVKFNPNLISSIGEKSGTDKETGKKITMQKIQSKYIKLPEV